MIVFTPLEKCQAEFESVQQILVTIGHWQFGASEMKTPKYKYLEGVMK